MSGRDVLQSSSVGVTQLRHHHHLPQSSLPQTDDHHKTLRLILPSCLFFCLFFKPLFKFERQNLNAGPWQPPSLAAALRPTDGSLQMTAL